MPSLPPHLLQFKTSPPPRLHVDEVLLTFPCFGVFAPTASSCHYTVAKELLLPPPPPTHRLLCRTPRTSRTDRSGRVLPGRRLPRPAPRAPGQGPRPRPSKPAAQRGSRSGRDSAPRGGQRRDRSEQGAGELGVPLPLRRSPRDRIPCRVGGQQRPPAGSRAAEDSLRGKKAACQGEGLAGGLTHRERLKTLLRTDRQREAALPAWMPRSRHACLPSLIRPAVFGTSGISRPQ